MVGIREVLKNLNEIGMVRIESMENTQDSVEKGLVFNQRKGSQSVAA